MVRPWKAGNYLTIRRRGGRLVVSYAFSRPHHIYVYVSHSTVDPDNKKKLSGTDVMNTSYQKLPFGSGDMYEYVIMWMSCNITPSI